MSDDQRPYWENAGREGYVKAMFASSSVGSHAMRRVWDTCLECADSMRIPGDARILELGCGDGTFANRILAP